MTNPLPPEVERTIAAYGEAQDKIDWAEQHRVSLSFVYEQDGSDIDIAFFEGRALPIPSPGETITLYGRDLFDVVRVDRDYGYNEPGQQVVQVNVVVRPRLKGSRRW